MADTELAHLNVETGETRETSSVSGRISFRYSGTDFIVPRVEVDLSYTDESVVGWTVRFPVAPASLADMSPLLAALGSSAAEALNQPADQQLEISFSARPEVLARLSPELIKLDMLSDMFRAGGNALLDLQNYEEGAVRVIEPESEVPG